MRFVIPLVLFVLLVVFLAIGLGHDPHEIPSPLIDKPAPAFQLSQLKDPSQTFSAEQMKGKVWVLNVWASWCFSCREEHPYLLQYAQSRAVPIYGLNSKDKREDALAWLAELGDPYVLSVSDLDGRVGIDYGVYGAPETYLIDRNGVIRFKYVGPIMPDVWQNQILPRVKALNK
ncbi:MAG TPA: DsbE family thiol:disulfide interchange protein [Pyrinomonadaceae bacterium]|jgi:cytochrome c biogenesis protein CcmG/thiol:disulfide interchange protein DsbE|nr:DsbE family thiol:disulfide interchange protein [Pyrinomonadaceae bacterium]